MEFVGEAQLVQELQSVFRNAITGGLISAKIKSTAHFDPHNIAYDTVIPTDID